MSQIYTGVRNTLRLTLPLLFVAAVFTAASIDLPLCVKLLLGFAVYTAFLPAGLLVRWSLSRRFPLAFVVYFFALLAAGLVVLLVPPVGEEYMRVAEAQRSFIQEAARCPLGTLLIGLQALLLAPLVEEILFRGILFEELRRFGTVTAYVASSLIFALLHWPGLGALPIFIVALSLAYAYHKYGLPASVLLHFLQNSIAFLSEVG